MADFVERAQHKRRKMRGGDQIDVVHAQCCERKKDIRKVLRRDFFAKAARADFFVLAVDAAKRAVRKEHRARAVFPADAGLLTMCAAARATFRLSRAPHQPTDAVRSAPQRLGQSKQCFIKSLAILMIF